VRLKVFAQPTPGIFARGDGSSSVQGGADENGALGRYRNQRSMAAMTDKSSYDDSGTKRGEGTAVQIGAIHSERVDDSRRRPGFK
jgi:hypothetical protein